MQAAAWEGHVSEQPEGVVPGSVYGRGNSGTAVSDNSFSGA